MPRAPYVARPPTPGAAPSTARRRLLAALLAVTLAVMVADLSGAVWTSHLRAGGAAVFGPVQRWLDPGGDADLVAAQADRERLAARVRELETAGADAAAVSRLLAAPSTSGARVLPARVVGVGTPGPAGPERVTIDVGTRDGVALDMPVVAEGGLVGRVVAAGPWTCDVLLVTAPDFAVGVRVVGTGAVGLVSGSGASAHAPGTLGVSLVAAGTLGRGQQVVTLGSVGSRPFPPGIPVGTVAATDDSRGRLTPRGSLRPAVDVGVLSVVGVLLTAPRSTPRPTVTGGAR